MRIPKYRAFDKNGKHMYEVGTLDWNFTDDSERMEIIGNIWRQEAQS